MRGARRSGFLLALCVAFGTASAHADTMWIPVIARAPGAHGSFIQSDVWFSNPGTTSAHVGMSFLPSGEGGTASSHEIDVPAGQQVRFTDAVSSLFGLDRGIGAVSVDSSVEIAVGSRTYDAAGQGGTYGELTRAVPTSELVPGGGTQTILWAGKNTGMRTNLGFVNTHPTATTVAVAFKSSTGGTVALKTFPLPALGHLQVNDVFTVMNVPTGTVVRIELTSPAVVLAYASMVDNGTNDPTIELARNVDVAAREFVIPAVAHAAGSAGSTWRSDVRIWNAETRVVGVRLRYFPNGGTAGEGNDVVLGAGELLELKDVLSRFGVTSGSGVLQLSATGRVVASSRLYNVTPHGSSGQAISGIPLTDAAFPGARLELGGAEKGEHFRTNAGFANLGDKAVRLLVELRADSGSVLGSKTLALAPGQAEQWNDLFGQLGAPEGSGAVTVDTTLASPSTEMRPSVIAWTSVVDNGSNDPSFVAPRNLAPESGFSIRRFRVTPDTLCKGATEVVEWEVLGAATSARVVAGGDRGTGLSGRAAFSDPTGEAPRLVVTGSTGTTTARIPFSAETAPAIGDFSLSSAQQHPYCVGETVPVSYSTSNATLVYAADATGYRVRLPEDGSGQPLRIGPPPVTLVATSACGEVSTPLEVETYDGGIRNVSVKAEPDVLYYYRWGQARLSNGGLCCGVRGINMISDVTVSIGNQDGVPIQSFEVTSLYGTFSPFQGTTSGNRVTYSGVYHAPLSWVTDTITVTVTDVCGNVSTGSTTVVVNICFPPEAVVGCACPTWCQSPDALCHQESYCTHQDPVGTNSCPYCYYPNPTNYLCLE